MTIHHLPVSGYEPQRWKNGTGITDEILLLPKGADRANFALRVSRATISEAGLFSAFPGVERVITLINGAGLTLDFVDRTVTLVAEQPFRFDSGLTPVGTPLDGAVRVVNVMTRRSYWLLASAQIVTEASEVAKGSITVIFALHGTWRITDECQTITLALHDTALVETNGRLVPVGNSSALMVSFMPAAT